MMHTRTYQAALHLRDGDDGRTLVGPLLPWGVEARVLDRGREVVESFERGSLAGVDPARVPLTARHPRDAETLPIGVTVELEDRADAAWGAWHVSDTALGNEVLALARDGVPLGLSVGFLEVPGGSRWLSRSRVVRTRAQLDHVAVVRVPRLCRSRRRGRTGRPRPSSGPSARHARLQMAVAMRHLGRNHRRWTPVSEHRLACIACRRPIFFGERCEGCKRELRQRRRRKPR